MSHTPTLPLDVLKTRIQSDAALAGLSLAGLRALIVTTEGQRALLAGFTANGCGYFMQGAIKFGLYEACKRRIFRELEGRGRRQAENRVPVWVASSACAEVVACLAFVPHGSDQNSFGDGSFICLIHSGSALRRLSPRTVSIHCGRASRRSS